MMHGKERGFRSWGQLSKEDLCSTAVSIAADFRRMKLFQTILFETSTFNELGETSGSFTNHTLMT
jgi:hypothetical protein